MGINGLLPLLKSIHKPCSLKKFDGKTLGVDAYGWLHRGTVACAMELALGKPTRKFVDFSMHRVRMLQHFGVIPYIIFDGDYLPSKGGTESDRAKRRQDSKKAGLELLKAGKTSQAYLEFQKAVDVTPEMARQLIDELKKCGVKYIVAPYEADAQMVYLERKGVIDGILSEDSDLLVFGAKCLLTKLDQYGNCIEINKADFSACKEINLTGWSEKEFRHMAILSGCDYLASINNMGLKTAYRMIRKHKTVEKVLRMLQFDGKYRVPQGYLEAFYQAEFTFLYQRVYCPLKEELVLHTQPIEPIDEEKMPFIGANLDPMIARGVAKGDLNPMSKLPIKVLTKTITTPSSTPRSNFRARPERMETPSSDLKKDKPLDRFLKKRTPLAELDINCFTPSPSQQEALRRNPGPWDASPVRPYLSRSATLPTLPQRIIPPTSGRTHPRTPTISEPRPPKRARLCDDSDGLVSPANGQEAELGRSRYFGTTVDPSPTVGKTTRRVKRKENITIFSDDSIDEIILGLPDVDTCGHTKSKATNKIPIFTDTVCNSVSSASGDVLTVGTKQHQDLEDPGLTSSMSLPSSFDQPATPTEVVTVPTAISDLKSRFSFESPVMSTPRTSFSSNQRTRPSNSSKPSRIPLATKAQASTSRPSPLQRLGVSAAGRARLPMTPPYTPIVASKSTQSRRSLLSKGNVPFPEVQTKKSDRVDPAMIPLPEPDDSENQALARGSEDQIIPNSDNDEPLSPIASETQLNFRRFTYSGN